MKKMFILVAAVITLAACSNEDNYIDEPVAAQITATIWKNAESRASESKWTPGDRIGITMDERYINMEYITNTDEGIFTGTTMYFKNKTTPVILSAYYPFAGTEGTAPGLLTASTDFEFQTADKQPDIDFLYAKAENVVGSDPNVKFTFSHRMSKLTLIFKDGSGMNVGDIEKYEISGLILDGTFDTATGLCSAKSDAGSKTLTVTPTLVKTEVAQPSLILFPQSTSGKSVTLKITDADRQDFACNLNFGDKGIEAGNNYQFTITVNKTGVIINQSTITDWTTNSSDADADAVDPE